MVTPLLTLLTDFGDTDAYVGMLKGTLLSRLPDARLVDLSHRLPHARPSGTAEIFAAALLLRRVYVYYPAGTIHLIGQDSGDPRETAGLASSRGERRALVAAAAGQYFLAPDSGVLTLVLAAEAHAAVYAVPLSQRTTFLARDVLAPLAVQLAHGVPASSLGQRVDDWRRLAVPLPFVPAPGELQGEVLHVDTFGNLLTNVTRTDAGAMPSPVVEIAGVSIHHWSLDYGEAPDGELFLIWGAENWLEISMRRASAATRLGVGAGEPVRMR